MAIETTDEHGNKAVWEYEVSPRSVRFQVQMPDGVITLSVDSELWDQIDREFSTQIHNAKPITERELVYVLQNIDSCRTYSREASLLTVVNMAKLAHDGGYMLRCYEAQSDREWNVSTLGEVDVMIRAAFAARDARGRSVS